MQFQGNVTFGVRTPASPHAYDAPPKSRRTSPSASQRPPATASLNLLHTRLGGVRWAPCVVAEPFRAGSFLRAGPTCRTTHARWRYRRRHQSQARGVDESSSSSWLFSPR
ncbi:hypothetical protein RRG08_014045 [Elysia crispata]|uniref:Uncharacterized protein n=1 Tax=Elysia crispata TaxID=231223 RepID=A0AAE0ZZ85_9GAST|nr:hypothetical protein RRG08_014045 [Elysia crispata]